MMLNLEEGSGWYMWLFYRHPDGQWVSLRKANEQDVNAINAAMDAAHQQIRRIQSWN
jgi:hypothetical protein